MPEGALGGLRVLDLSTEIAGPYCATLLGGLGATVVKLEEPRQGDPLRRQGPFVKNQTSSEASLPFLFFNTDKQGVTLDLANPEGAALFRKLAAWADVVVESFKPGVMAAWGLGYDELAALNPALIVTAVTPFGQTGPYRDYEASDITAQAMGGLTIMVGEPDREPLALGGSQALCSAGVAAFTGTMTALVAREIHGFGQHVDVSVLEAVANTEWHATSAYAFDGTNRKRRGRLIDQKVLRAADGYMGSFINWPRIKEVIGGALEDERFATPAGRAEHTQAFGEAIESWLLQRGKIEAYHEGQAQGIPWGYIATMQDLLESPQYGAREVFHPLEHAATGPALYARPPFRIGTLPDGPWAPAPRLGEHNTQVYGALLGLGKDDLVRLRETGVI